MSPLSSAMVRRTVVESPISRNASAVLDFESWDAIELILEAWAQGLLVGSLVILIAITLANMRRGVLLHKVSTAT